MLGAQIGQKKKKPQEKASPPGWRARAGLNVQIQYLAFVLDLTIFASLIDYISIPPTALNSLLP